MRYFAKSAFTSALLLFVSCAARSKFPLVLGTAYASGALPSMIPRGSPVREHWLLILGRHLDDISPVKPITQDASQKPETAMRAPRSTPPRCRCHRPQTCCHHASHVGRQHRIPSQTFGGRYDLTAFQSSMTGSSLTGRVLCPLMHVNMHCRVIDDAEYWCRD